MSQLDFDFVPAEDASGNWPGSATWIVSGCAEFASLAPAALTQAQRAGPRAAIVPVGESGRLLWKQLSHPLSRLVAPPDRDALLVLPRSSAPERGELWEWIAGLPAASLTWGEPASAALADPRRPALVPEASELPAWLRRAIAAFRPASNASAVDLTALLAGLYQVHDDLDQSHRCSQSIEGQGRRQAADYWHAIMHRREGDFGNSKYWFRQLGRHPLFPELAACASRVLERSSDPSASGWKETLTEEGWNPAAFVDFCQRCARDEDSMLAANAREIQWQEMLILLDHTWRDATGL